MDAARFDRWTRTLATHFSRRRTAQVLAFAAFGIARATDGAVAGPRCKNCSCKCKRDKQCCSGVCKRKRGKKKGHCARRPGGCRPGQSEAFCGGADVSCTSSAGAFGFCNTTIGDQGYCTVGIGCFACTMDDECVPTGGPGSACIRCAAMCPNTGGTACASPV